MHKYPQSNKLFVNLVASNDSVGSAKRWRHPGNSDSLRGQSGASSVMRGLFRHSFGSMLSSFLAYWSRSNFVKCLNDNAVLSVGLEVHDLQMVFLSIFLREVHGFINVIRGGGEFVANIVSKNLAVPVFSWRWFPCYLSELNRIDLAPFQVKMYLE